jgi:hypothetical protein
MFAGGDLFYDEEKAFNKAVHGGNIRKGSLLALLNPWGDAAKNVKRAKESGTVKDSNLKGDGLTLGGAQRHAMLAAVLPGVSPVWSQLASMQILSPSLCRLDDCQEGR